MRPAAARRTLAPLPVAVHHATCQRIQVTRTPDGGATVFARLFSGGREHLVEVQLAKHIYADLEYACLQQYMGRPQHRKR
jgi:hypothetical protein